MFARVAQDDGDRHAAEITVLREARDGTIWVGSNKELYRLDQTGGHVTLRRVEIGLLNNFPEQREIVDLLEDRRRSMDRDAARFADAVLTAAQRGTRSATGCPGVLLQPARGP
jgi:hypothetical protein